MVTVVVEKSLLLCLWRLVLLLLLLLRVNLGILLGSSDEDDAKEWNPAEREEGCREHSGKKARRRRELTR